MGVCVAVMVPNLWLKLQQTSSSDDVRDGDHKRVQGIMQDLVHDTDCSGMCSQGGHGGTPCAFEDVRDEDRRGDLCGHRDCSGPLPVTEPHQSRIASWRTAFYGKVKQSSVGRDTSAKMTNNSVVGIAITYKGLNSRR